MSRGPRTGNLKHFLFRAEAGAAGSRFLGLQRVLLANMLAGAIIGIALHVVEHGDDGGAAA